MRWKPITWTGGKYEVSDCGNVVCTVDERTGKAVRKYLKPAHAGRGYPVVYLHVNGWGKREYVHTLVLETFIGPRPEGYVCNHKDGNKLNACVGNLEWVTERENNQHAVDTGLRTFKKGPEHPNYGKTTTELFGKNRVGINNPFYGKTHSKATREIIARKGSGERSSRAKLTNEQAGLIRLDYTAGVTKAALAEKYGVSWWVVHDIVLNRTYKK